MGNGNDNENRERVGNGMIMKMEKDCNNTIDRNNRVDTSLNKYKMISSRDYGEPNGIDKLWINPQVMYIVMF